MIGDYEAVPVLSTVAGRVFTAILATVEVGIGLLWLLLAFARHQDLYGLLGMFPRPVTWISYAVVVLGLGGLLWLHDAVHRYGRAIRGV